jgi:CMP-2-keto-3-deoxyoctulosonic acid synthetase
VTLEGRLIGQKQRRSISDDCLWRRAEVQPDADVGRGVQCFDAGFLGTYTQLPDSPLQLAEDLEQLKVVENGYKIKVSPPRRSSPGSRGQF